jgi:hypothetical protein
MARGHEFSYMQSPRPDQRTDLPAIASARPRSHTSGTSQAISSSAADAGFAAIERA